MIENGVMRVLLADRKMSDGELQRIRENGEGNGFTALDTADGFRRDGSLWFGTCSVCGERVTNSWRDGVWEHQVVTEEVRHADGSLARSASRLVDYCPTGAK
jgi:hypothetical protein